MSKDNIFPKIKKKLSNFINDEEGTILRSKAAIVGPVAIGTVLLMNKEMTINAEASKFHSHMSHSSHSSGTTGTHSNNLHTSHNNTMPAHSSHSSGSTSGFSHTAATFSAEARAAENN